MHTRIAFINRSSSVFFYWSIGLLVGMSVAYFHIARNAPVLDGGIFMPASIAGMILTSIIPIVLALILSRFHLKVPLLLLLFLSGVFYGFSRLFLSAQSAARDHPLPLTMMLLHSCCSCILLFLSAVHFKGHQKQMILLDWICLSFAAVFSVFQFLFER